MWDENAWLVPRIRAALDAKVPPTAAILRDPGIKEYGVWDLKLAMALHIYDGMLRGNIPVYWDESDRVAFDVKTGVSKSRAAVERREKQLEGKDRTPGQYLYPVPRVIDGGPLPTREEWYAEKLSKQGGVSEGQGR